MAKRFVPIARAVFLGLLLVLGLPTELQAHTEFDHSVPADGAVLDVPPQEVMVAFTKPVTLVDPGFEVLLPDGSVIVPASESEGGMRWTVTLPEEIGAGELALRYEVLAADDGHPISGGFSFTIVQGLDTTTTSSTTPATSTTTQGNVATSVATSDGVDTRSTPEADLPEVPVEDRLAAEEFLNSGGRGTPLIGWVARALGLMAVLTGVGLLAMVTRVVADDELAVVSMLELAALAGMLLVVAAGLESYSLATQGGIGLDSLWSSRLGVSPLLRAVAGSLLAALALSADHRFARWALALAVTVGVGSYAFDGHTVSTGPRWIHATVDFVHVMAAGVWAGGLVLLFVQLRSEALTTRRRVELVLRFSTIAGAALIPVLVAGVGMVWFVADSPGDLVGTDWGRVLVAKVSLVALAVSLGATNRYKLLPQLDSSAPTPADSPALADASVIAAVASAIRLEVIVLGLAVLTTAALVAASTS